LLAPIYATMTVTVMRWLALVCFLSTLQASGQAPWTWEDSRGVVRSRAELDTILSEHRKWVGTKGIEGKRANLSSANLSGANLDGADLSEANLDHVVLSRAFLRKAVLKGADFTKANLSEARLDCADLTGADLNGGGVGLKGAVLQNANLQKAHLDDADFTDADLSEADLSGATLSNGTDLEFADLYHAIYQPNGGTEPWIISSAFHLADLTYKDNPAPIIDLRNSLRDAGNVQPEREVNEAFHRHDPNLRPSLLPDTHQNRRWTPPHWLQEVLYLHREAVHWNQEVLYWLGEVLNWLQQVMFDWTCGWGADPGRPLVIIAVTALLCTPIYWIGMHYKLKKGGLFLVATGARITTAGSKERVLRIIVSPVWRVPMNEPSPRELGPKAWALAIWRARKKWLRLEYKALRTALLFSLMSVFNIGFEDFNCGLWIRMIQTREFDIRARGWMRSVSGVQSLLGVGLLALSILSYFGHPFE
jgi:uncharacterized protein YjbI with pentapeptide repeats